MNLANKLTILRILLIPVFIISMIYPYSPFIIDIGAKSYNIIAIFIFFFAMFTDILDGMIARVKKQRSKLGTFLDPLADKLSLICAFITFSALKIIPTWVTIVVISKEIITISGWLLILAVHKQSKIMPSIWGKISTFLQSLTIIGALINFGFLPHLWRATVLFTIIALLHYTIRGSKRLSRED